MSIRCQMYKMLILCEDNSHMMPIQVHPVRTDQLYIRFSYDARTIYIQCPYKSTPKGQTSCIYDAHMMQGQFTYNAHTNTSQSKDRPVVYMMLIRCKDNSCTMSIQTHPKVPKPSSYHVNTIFVLTYMAYWLWAGLSSPFSVSSFPPLPY